ncbi:MAG TPA: N-carbamoylputrescine amidase [Cyanobacteria bacterium UBA8156]|jgi:N-carbamoylputrescine amidase|nr:N-carbamoylputrescine amidase [Cyanobacteria bacterium UBA8156]
MKVAVIQCALGGDRATNVAQVLALVAQAATQGAQVVLPPELFGGVYFCREERPEFFDWAYPIVDHPDLPLFQEVARTHHVFLPVSLFERDGPHYYNSVVAIAPTGDVLGVYRKSHIPDGPGYEEKFYFRPGNTGFRVWTTPWGRVGVGICWDQWFPEAARAMVLQGADVLLYPTAIGTEPAEPDLQTCAMWQRVMVGHAVANVVPVAAANRIGTEGDQTFYGNSFICDRYGEMLTQFGATEVGVLFAEFDPERVRQERAAFGFFRDRRPELYGQLVEP